MLYYSDCFIIEETNSEYQKSIINIFTSTKIVKTQHYRE